MIYRDKKWISVVSWNIGTNYKNFEFQGGLTYKNIVWSDVAYIFKCAYWPDVEVKDSKRIKNV